MAIKSISQLEQFDNHTPNSSISPFGVGGNLTVLKNTPTGLGTISSILTEDDINYVKGEGWPTSMALQPNSTSSYYESLFEISQPSNTGLTSTTTEYHSKKLTYSDLVKDIIWDVKGYLNWRNLLNNYNLSRIVDGDQHFNGNKVLDGTLSISNSLSTNYLDVEVSGYVNKLSTTMLSSLKITTEELTAIDLTATNANISWLTVDTEMLVCCNIDTSTQDIYFNGYAYGLKDNSSTKTTRGTFDGKVDSTLSGKPDRCGDPVMFKDGRPYELTCVNYARNLVSSDGSLLNVGNGKLRKVDGIVDDDSPTSTYKAVYLSAGQVYATNVIDFAEHAYWSDLGERYVADAIYDPGTLVKFGGEKEITIADDDVNAIVSTKAFDLNAGLKNGTVIALCGRVPTKVKGKIQKFDRIMLSDTPGIACRWDGKERVIGRALESNSNDGIKLVECVTKFKL